MNGGPWVLEADVSVGVGSPALSNERQEITTSEKSADTVPTRKSDQSLGTYNVAIVTAGIDGVGKLFRVLLRRDNESCLTKNQG